MNAATIIWHDQTTRTVPVHARAAGLCVTEIDLDGDTFYTVTHEGSGMGVFPLFPRRITDPAQAERALHVAAASGVDWTDSHGDLVAIHGKGRLAPLFNRMRLAVWPPRRARRHRRKVRMLPYKAQTKREAVREMAGIDYLSWSEVWVYRRRGPFWSISPAVVRQPCTRFGVAHKEVDNV